MAVRKVLSVVTLIEQQRERGTAEAVAATSSYVGQKRSRVFSSDSCRSDVLDRELTFSMYFINGFVALIKELGLPAAVDSPAIYSPNNLKLVIEVLCDWFLKE